MSGRKTRARVLTTLLMGIILVMLVGVVAATVMAHEIVLILFLAILFGVFLGNASQFVRRHLPISHGWALGTVTAAILVCFGLASLLLGYRVEQQFADAEKHLDKGLDELREIIRQRPALRSSIDSTPMLSDILGMPAETSTSAADSAKSAAQKRSLQQKRVAERTAKDETEPSNVTDSNSSKQEQSNGSSDSILDATSGSLLPQATNTAAQVIGRIFRTSLGIVANSALIFFVGLFLASNPAVYRDGLVLLFPQHRRERMREVLNQSADTLWRWLLGRFASMLITGVGAGIILWLLGVPMAVSLGLITGLLTFVPNIGAAIALLLTILFALPQGIWTAAMVVPAYLGLQLLESYVVTPLIQRHQVGVPPALLLSAQAIMGVLFGFLGAAVASPLLAVSQVIVRQLYVLDLLESSPTPDRSQQAADAHGA